jgi:hypothetical protein
MIEKKITNNYRNAGRKKILNATRKVSMIPNDKIEDYEKFVKSLQYSKNGTATTVSIIPIDKLEEYEKFVKSLQYPNGK